MVPPDAWTSEALAERLGARHEGPSRSVEGLCSPDAPRPGTVGVAGDATQAAALVAGGVAALVVEGDLEAPETAGGAGPSLLRVASARLALAELSALFDTRPDLAEGVHPSAVVHPSARLGDGVRVGPLATLGPDVVVGADTRIGAGCAVGTGARLGAGCRLHANVTLYDGVRLGDRVQLHSGVVIGGDGFGYAAGPQGARKIHHLGAVAIGDDVEIGACTTVDRGTLGDTAIGPRSKIDNHCQIAHNVRIGSDCLIAGTTALAGSVRIGDRVVMGGGVVVADHVTIGDGVRLAGHTGISKDVPAGETWAGYIGQPYRRFVRQLYLLGRLERIWQVVRELAGTAGAVRAERDEGRDG